MESPTKRIMLHSTQSTSVFVLFVATLCCPASADEHQAGAADGHPPSSVHKNDSQTASRSLLKWGNGDSLWGHPIGMQKETLTWKSPLFASPLQIDVGVLSEIRYERTSPPELAADSYWITFANSNVMTGRLVDVTTDKLVFDSPHHGRFSVLRDRVQTLQRDRNDQTIFAGPDGLEGWQAEATFGGQAWQEEPSGAIRAPRGNGTVTRRLTLGKRCEVELHLAFTERPDFAFHFVGSKKSLAARIEVWDDALVAAIGNQYAELMTLSEDVRSLRLHALVDSKAGVLAVYSGAGRLLGSVESNRMNAVPRMLTLKAIDAPLTLKRIRVSGWSGELPLTLARGQNRIHLSDGSVHYGVLKNLSDGMLEIEPAKQSPAADGNNTTSADKRLFSIADVSQIFLSAESPEHDPQSQAHVSWHDGTHLTGTLVSLHSDRIELRTPNSDGVVSCSLQGARSIHLPTTQPIEGQPDRLFFPGGSVSGTLTVEDSDIPIRWTPVGGRNSSALVSADSARFQRGKEPDQMALDTDRFPDVIYMKSGDVFPCAVQRTDDRHLYQASPVCVTEKVLLDEVQAVEFGSSHRARHEGFAGDQWKRVSGRPKVLDNGTALTFSGSDSFGHAGALTGDSMSFRMKWSQHTYGSVGLFLFCDDVSSPDSATPVTFQLQQQMLSVHNRPLPEHNVGFWGFNAGDPQSTLSTTDCAANVRITLDNGCVTVELDDKVRRVFELNQTGGSGRGFLIRSNFLEVHFGNGQPVIDNGVRGKAELTDFVVKSTAGASTRQFIRTEARDLALTVPRFRRDDPLTHVLLAPNGDLLRGRLQEISEREVVFDSRLETFRFPRARVASVVWIPDPNASDSDAPKRPPSAVQAQLDNGYTVTLTPRRMDSGDLVGSSHILGECRVPAAAIRDLFLGTPNDLRERVSYVNWIRRDAKEPQWEMPKDGGADLEAQLAGTMAQDFELARLEGGSFRLSDHRDKVVILDFWASWCGPCVAALPEYIDAVAGFDPDQVIFVAVNLEEPKDRIQAFLDEHRLSPTVLMDRGSVVARRFQVSGIPHSVIVGPGGMIRHVTVGYKPGVGARIQEHIAAILAE